LSCVPSSDGEGPELRRETGLARAVEAGAGLNLSVGASAPKIARAVRRLLALARRASHRYPVLADSADRGADRRVARQGIAK